MTGRDKILQSEVGEGKCVGLLTKFCPMCFIDIFALLCYMVGLDNSESNIFIPCNEINPTNLKTK